MSVTNVGARAGEEVVQLYLSCPESTQKRAPKVLVGFGRLALAPANRKTLRMRVTGRELRYYDADRQRFEVESTTYLLRAGPSSQDLPIEAHFIAGAPEGVLQFSVAVEARPRAREQIGSEDVAPARRRREAAWIKPTCE